MPYTKLLLALLLLIASAYISLTLPISEKGIPFTAQSLVVFYIAGMFKPKESVIIMITYLILGILGLPVFAEGTSGWNKVAGSSGGFLYGFTVASWTISTLTTKLAPLSLIRLIIIMLIGTIVLFAFGLGHLANVYGWSKALEYGLYPFWVMALVKAIMASLLVFWSRSRGFK